MTDHRRVPGIGPLPCDVVMIGEAPGFNETQQRKPFVGKSGIELTGHLDRVGLPRHRIRLTNLVKLQPPQFNGKQLPPSSEDIQRDEPEILEELAAARPRWIGAIGRVAARYLIGNLDMESAHGMAYPLRAELRERLTAKAVTAQLVERTLSGAERALQEDWTVEADDSWLDTCRVVPLYHPAAGLHNPEIQPLVWYDLRTFGAYVHGRLHPQTPVDGHPRPRYIDGLAGWPRRVELVACDTEGVVTRPWSLQIACRPGRANVLRYASLLAWRESARRIFREAPRVVFQNALWDMPVLEAMGIDVDWSKVDDIFIMADVLRLVPRGLKAGARRDCAMEMRSYNEVIAPAEKRLAREYVDAAIAARTCFECGGSGKVVEQVAAAPESGGKKARKSKAVQCPAGCVEGGLWEPREPEVVMDPETELYKVKSGWEVQRYLRSLQKDIDKGKYDRIPDTESDEESEPDSPRHRVANWPEEVREQISAALGSDMPTPTLDDVPLREAVDYAGRDADATLRRYPILKRQIEELDLVTAYRLDVDVMPVAAEIQKNGMRINRQHFHALTEELEERKLSLAVELEARIGRRINPGSPDDVADLMYVRHKKFLNEDDEREFVGVSFDLTPEKWTPSRKRGSVDEKTLEGLKLKYSAHTEFVAVCDLVLQWKMCDKVQQFAKKLPRMADSYDRIHTRIKVGPATFRWASAEPNLQQIPTRQKHGEDLGKRVREGFEAAEGRLMYARDFDQVEMRVLAWYAQDEALLRAFAEGVDIHRLTASKVFRVPFDEVTSAQRTSAKNIGFGIVYGVTARGLKAQMDLRGQNWTVEQCQALIDSYLYEAYPGVGRFLLDAHAEARQHNMVRSLMGHVRYCPAVHSPIRTISEEALRQAANFKIQCTAAELMKIAERYLLRDCGKRFRELDAMIVMSMHDELVDDIPDDEGTIEEVDALMQTYMTNPYPLDGIEISSGAKWGRRWSDTK